MSDGRHQYQRKKLMMLLLLRLMLLFAAATIRVMTLSLLCEAVLLGRSSRFLS